MTNGFRQDKFCIKFLVCPISRNYSNDAKEAESLDCCGLPLNWGLTLGMFNTAIYGKNSTVYL